MKVRLRFIIFNLFIIVLVHLCVPEFLIASSWQAALLLQNASSVRFLDSESKSSNNHWILQARYKPVSLTLPLRFIGEFDIAEGTTERVGSVSIANNESALFIWSHYTILCEGDGELYLGLGLGSKIINITTQIESSAREDKITNVYGSLSIGIQTILQDNWRGGLEIRGFKNIEEPQSISYTGAIQIIYSFFL